MGQGCSGNCASCGGCGKELVLTKAEAEFLQKLGQADSMTPVYLEDTDRSREEYSLILQCLEKKGLISMDYDGPLKGFDAAAYASWPVKGSVSLTARGQSVLELMELQGIREE